MGKTERGEKRMKIGREKREEGGVGGGGGRGG